MLLMLLLDLSVHLQLLLLPVLRVFVVVGVGGRLHVGRVVARRVVVAV